MRGALVHVITSALVFVLLLTATPNALAQPTPPPVAPTRVALDALGGASLEVPGGWTDVKKEPALIVREQAPDPATQQPFFVLLAAIEEGPPIGAPTSPAPGVPWLKVRDNIVEAAAKGGRKVTLAVGDAFKDLAGFEGRLLEGEVEAPPPAGAAPGTPPKKVFVELVALVKNQRLLTIGLVTDVATAGAARELLAKIAKTVRLGP